jgi:hypothetical protein
MDLLELLEVDKNRIPWATTAAVRYLNQNWAAAGRPSRTAWPSVWTEACDFARP